MGVDVGGGERQEITRRGRRPPSRCRSNNELIVNYWDPGKTTEHKAQSKHTPSGPRFPHLDHEGCSQGALQLEEPIILTPAPHVIGGDGCEGKHWEEGLPSGRYEFLGVPGNCFLCRVWDRAGSMILKDHLRQWQCQSLSAAGASATWLEGVLSCIYKSEKRVNVYVISASASPPLFPGP